MTPALPQSGQYAPQGHLRVDPRIRRSLDRARSPDWVLDPELETLDGVLEVGAAQAVRRRVVHALDDRPRLGALDREQDVADREPMGDDEHGLLRPREHLPEAAGEALSDPGSALAAGGELDGRAVSRPGSVRLEQAAFELADVDVVQLRQNQPWHLPPCQRDVRGLPRPLELRDDAEADGRLPECLAERARLLHTGLG